MIFFRNNKGELDEGFRTAVFTSKISHECFYFKGFTLLHNRNEVATEYLLFFMSKVSHNGTTVSC